MRFVRLITFTLLPSLSAWAALNDTGQSQCYDGTSLVPCTASNSGDAAAYPRQDGRFGRDAAATAGALTKTGGGAAGFDFTKLGADGNPLGIQDQPWSDSGNEGAGTQWSCVRDNLTNLIWEVKTNAVTPDLRDRDWTYTWYSSNGSTNGGNAGTQDTGSVTNNNCFDPSRCDTEQYTADVNDLDLCGETANDWRLPTRDELKFIVHYGTWSPAIDTSYFPNTLSIWYWSASSYAPAPSYAWLVNFSDGYGYAGFKNYPNYVRLVRGGQ